MATPDSTTDQSEELNSEPPAMLEDIIEAERTRLMTARTVLGCTAVAINNDQCVNQHQFVYGDVIELARTMIDETIDHLDSVVLRAFYERLRKASLGPLAEIEGDGSHGMTMATSSHSLGSVEH